MVKQRRHARVVKTKKGKRKIIINPKNIRRPVKPSPKLVKQGQNRSRIYTKWGKKEALETINDYLEDELGDNPTLIIQLTGDESFWNADVGVGWYRGPELFQADVLATDPTEFDRLLREVVAEAVELTDGYAFPLVRFGFAKDGTNTIQEFVEFNAKKIKEYLRSGGKVLENIVAADNLEKTGELIKGFEGNSFGRPFFSVPGFAGLNLDEPRKKPIIKPSVTSKPLRLMPKKPMPHITGPQTFHRKLGRDTRLPSLSKGPAGRLPPQRRRKPLPKKERKYLP